MICFFGVFLRDRLCKIFCNGMFLILQKMFNFEVVSHGAVLRRSSDRPEPR